MSTSTFKPYTGPGSQAFQMPLPPGRASQSDSRPVAVDAEAFALFQALVTAAGDVTTPLPAYTFMALVDVTLTVDTSAYAPGDVLFDSQIVPACVRANDALGTLHSFALSDEDDQKAGIRIVFMSSNVTMGTENAVPSISDVNSRTILGYFDIAAADYMDLGGTSEAFKAYIGLIVKPVSGSDDIYMAGILLSGTPTYTATGPKARLGFI